MKKKVDRPQEDELRAEYAPGQLKDGIRGKYVQRYRTGTNVVLLAPDGPQSDDLSPDVVAALATDPPAKIFFDSLATFYRKNFIRWIESAKRPETRRARITEMLRLLKAGQKQR